MAPQTRRMPFPKVVIERETDSEESSDEELDDEEEDDDVVEDKEEEKYEEEEKLEVPSLVLKKKGKTPITLTLKKVCKVSLFKEKTLLVSCQDSFFFSFFLVFGSNVVVVKM